MNPYHSGALAVQARAGVSQRAAYVGSVAFSTSLFPMFGQFLAMQPMLVIGAEDADGQAWCSLITGRPGFMKADSPDVIQIQADVLPDDPLAIALGSGSTMVGTTAIDPRLRRRIRVNGTATPSTHGLTVHTERVFGNCPKYLQRRELLEVPDESGTAPAEAPAPDVRRSTRLTGVQQSFIRAADTFFMTTVAPGDVEASHRGGNPGFVEVVSPTSLRWCDYPGNTMFLSLGNIEIDGRAGLLFVDWSTGTTIQLTGRARTTFSDDGTRSVGFDIAQIVEVVAASRLRWSEPMFSPSNPPVSCSPGR
ncbi:pyridoxamine 5'-phosphate oxidase family protein [Streptomyces sp. NPDC085937]|uniref:pyridoxamine 5'-phosphate oxidase family protein n=1 Tax=Streptomyces sp. NPDC085937 TaxID=3365742 RepID=UPI0037D8FBFF